MFSRFFIDRPIFASVLSILITLAGGIAFFRLPIANFPQIALPTVSIDCRYPGANAEVLAQSVAAPIEQMINGVEGMMYMTSTCSNDGLYSLTVTFKHGVNVNIAQVLVQNRVSLAMASLPDVVKQSGVTTRKRSPDILLSVNVNSPDGRYDQLYLSNFALSQVKEELMRLPGVAEVSMMGQRDYSLRVWLDPDRLAELQLTAGDVVQAIRDENTPISAGQVGQEPIALGVMHQFPISVKGRLKSPEEFAEIVLKATPDGRYVRLRDVGRTELSARLFDSQCRLSGKPSVGMPIFQFPDANALETADLIKAKMEELKTHFPEGVNYEIQYDTTPFIRESIEKVFQTLLEAVGLVAIVVVLFLQNWRSAIIPLIAVPVAIVGTFAVMAVFGFSINNLTLFGLVLAIGIVVDDAIVVVESVEHHMEHGLSPRDATIKAMDQVSGPVIAVGLVLSAVFVPCAFLTGVLGQFFRQFALTIAVSTIISAFNSLTLSPALTAILLRPRSETPVALPRPAYAFIFAALSWYLFEHGWHVHLEWFDFAEGWAGLGAVILSGAVLGLLLGRFIDLLLRRFFAWFDQTFRFITRLYTGSVRILLRGTFIVLLAYGGLLYATYVLDRQTPRGFIPQQDLGYLFVGIQLPDAASAERTDAVTRQVEEIASTTPGVKHILVTTGQSFVLNASGPNYASGFVILKDFKERRDPAFYFEAIAENLRQRFAERIPEATVSVYLPPPVRGIGRAGGFRLMVEDRGEGGLEALQKAAEGLADRGKNHADVKGLSNALRSKVPQLYFDVNRRECLAMNVPLVSVFDTLQVYLGSLYVNDYTAFGRNWQVIVQADQRYRDQIEDVSRLQVRSARGKMVPLGTLASVREVNGPLLLTRHNMYSAAIITGSAAPGVSSGQALDTVQELASKELPPWMAYEWTEVAFLERQTGNTALWVFFFAVVMVFLVLAAQYESWSLPFAVILVVPLCLLSALFGVWLAKMDVNIFTQIGFVVLVGLASKNAILIVEFAQQKREEGLGSREAILEACTLRLRPIVMTSLAFVLGVVPLMIARGAGMEMRQTLGTAVFSGMLGVTIFGLFLTPVFFLVVDRVASSTAFASPWIRLGLRILLNVILLGIPYLITLGIRKAPAHTPIQDDLT